MNIVPSSGPLKGSRLLIYSLLRSKFTGVSTISWNNRKEVLFVKSLGHISYSLRNKNSAFNDLFKT